MLLSWLTPSACRSAVGGGLDVIEFSVASPTGFELVVGADFEEARAVEDDDQVGHADGGEAVRNQKSNLARLAAVPGRGSVTLEEGVFGFGVEGGGGFVQNKEERLFAHEAAGEGEFLPLAKRDFDPAGPCRAELGVQAGGQA